MGWILLEALLALTVMLVLVWWTFRSRREGEVPVPEGVTPVADEPGPEGRP